jgi:hypothetical protein
VKGRRSLSTMIDLKQILRELYILDALFHVVIVQNNHVQSHFLSSGLLENEGVEKYVD